MKPRYPGPLPQLNKIEMERRKALLDMYAESKNKKGKGPIASIGVPKGDMMRPVPKGPPAKRPKVGPRQKPIPLRGPGKPKY
jgi:hypothetical protein